MSFVGGFLRALIPLSLGVAILAHPYPARAEKRVALVIGNSGYEQSPSSGTLPTTPSS